MLRPAFSKFQAPRILRSILVLLTIFLLASPWCPGDPLYTTTGNVPLPDLGPGTYQGFQGGLYPSGSNQRPAAHLAQGARAAASITARNAAGAPDPAGRIVMVSIGLSHTLIEFFGFPPEVPMANAFVSRATSYPALNPQVALVNGAQGGQPADVWADDTSAQGSIVWGNLDTSLSSRGLTAAQVQVAWVKLAERIPARLGAFPAHAQVLQSHLEQVMRILKARFPNIAIAYCSCRTRAYTDGSPSDPTGSPLNPEPYAYESGFSVKWLVERQIQNEPTLNCDPARGAVVAPWITWGPYLWADGTNPRSDGMTCDPQDVRSTDSTHPSASGAMKVSSQLLAHCCADPTAGWFRRATATPPAIDVSADVRTGSAPFAVQFSASGGAAAYAWSFDDGMNSLDQNPVKSFLVPGMHLVRMCAADASGNSVVRELSIAVGVERATPSLAVGYGDGLVLNDGGAVLSSGRNNYGQLGTSGGDRASFQRVIGVLGVRRIASGFAHSLAIGADGSLRTWGRNFSGQLGVGSNVDSALPQLVAGLPAISGVAGGLNHTLAWTADGSLWTWGSNVYGQLGDGTFNARTVPARVGLPYPIVAAAAGNDHGLALRLDGQVVAWGANANGQLGDGTLLVRTSPVRVLTLTDITQVAAGSRHSLALRADGTVMAWGQNISGEVGDGTNVRRAAPVPVAGLSGVVQIAAGMSFSVALRGDGTVWTWGRNLNGELGDGTIVDRWLPAQVGINSVTAIAAGGEQVLMLRADGSVFVQGMNANGQLGLGAVSGPVVLPRANGVWLTQ